MQICAKILTRIELIIVTLIQIVQTIVETVCEWVSTVIKTIVEVTKKVCKWLPWPLDKLCNWVTELIEVVETVWEWVCEEVIVRILRWIEVAVRYVFYLVRWICWLVDWPLRFIFEILPCLLGVNLRKRMALCVKVLVDDEGVPAVSFDRVQELIAGARERLEQCNLELCVASFDTVTAPDDIEDFTCGAGGFFSKHHLFFERNSCASVETAAVTITAYFVPKYEGANGCAIPRTDYIVIGEDATLATVAHEIGHHADLTHRDDRTNVMFDAAGNDATAFTRWQCCLIRSARYATIASLRACGVESIDVRLARAIRQR